MRWIFFSLLLLNLAFAGWQAYLWHAQGKPELDVPATVQDNNVPGIVLLNEDRASARLKANATEKKSKPVKNDNDQARKEANDEPNQPANPVILAGDSGRGLASCEVFGPFYASQERDKLKQHLDHKQIVSFLYDEDVIEPPQYWVYVRPEKAGYSVQSLMNELRREKIESFLLNEGGSPKGLSLGLFEKETEALTLIRRLAELGISANKIDKTNSYTNYWVIVDKQKSSNFDESFLNSLVNTYPHAQRGEKNCKPVAS